DLCTGWGTPTGSNLINALLAPPPALRITPVDPITFSGPVAGPFTPSSATFFLTNGTTLPLNWNASNTASWLDLLPASGTLSPGGPNKIVPILPNSSASTQSAGTYPAQLLFLNTRETSAQNRAAILQVLTAPAILSQPANLALLEGMSASFAVHVATNGGLSYQWRFDNGIDVTNLTDNANILGSTTTTLTIANVSPANVGAYSLLVSNAVGTTFSSNAFLSLVPGRPTITLQPPDQ